MGALLTADIEDFLLGEGEDGLEQEGALADARLSAEEHDAAGNETAAEDTVQLVVVHVYAGVVVAAYFREPHHAVLAQLVAGLGSGRRGGLTGGVGGHAHFLHRVPLATGGALANPLGTLLSAITADVNCFIFGHRFFMGLMGLVGLMGGL